MEKQTPDTSFRLPSVSVCMATWNGAAFIADQIASILVQLADRDELIISDDGSSDDTLGVIRRFDDRRIRLLSPGVRLGVVGNFQRAIQASRGSIIMLSDQDDIWEPDKYRSIMKAFIARPNATMVYSNAHMMDRDGKSLGRLFFDRRVNAGLLRNIIRPRYLGCTMAFRRSVAGWACPFPHDLPMHDMWIGLISDIRGENVYIRNPLIRYRSHSESVTAKSPTPPGLAGVALRLRWRLVLIKNIIFHLFH